MWGIFRPLFAYKKYRLANKILKQTCSSFVWVTNEPHEQPYLSEKNFGETFLSAFLLQYKNIDTLRLIEAIELLEENWHLIAHRNHNLYDYSIEATKEGERALTNGFYVKKEAKFWGLVIGSPIATILLTQLPKLLKMW